MLMYLVTVQNWRPSDMEAYYCPQPRTNVYSVKTNPKLEKRGPNVEIGREA